MAASNGHETTLPEGGSARLIRRLAGYDGAQFVTSTECLRAMEIDQEIADSARVWRLITGRTDLEWWCGYYLAPTEDWVPGGNALHHDLLRIWGEIVNPQRYPEGRGSSERGGHRQLYEARAAPRGHSKSTYWAFALPLHCILYMTKRYIVIKEASEELAAEALARIRSALQSDRIQADYGNLLDPNSTSQGRIITLTGVRIDILGMSSSTRGRNHRGFRPDLFILDDVQKNEHAYSDSTRERHRRHLKTEILKSGDAKYCDYLFVGTILHSDCLLATTLTTPGWNVEGNARMGIDGPPIYQAVTSWPTRKDLWDRWREIFTDLNNPRCIEEAYQFYLDNEELMLEGAEVLWPEYHPLYKLMVEQVMLGQAAFSSELQNIPRSSEDRLFDPDKFTYVERADIDVEKDYARIVGYWDPSVGVEDAKAQEYGQHDWACWVILGLHKSGCVDILDVRCSKIEVEEQIKFWWELNETWWPDLWGVEANGFQAVIFPLHKQMLSRQNRDLADAGQPLREAPTWRPIENLKNKVLRVNRLQGPLHNGQIRIIKDRSPDMRIFIQMFNDFPTSHMMDGPDALEAGYRMIQPRRKPFDEWVPKGQDSQGGDKPPPLATVGTDQGTEVALVPPGSDAEVTELEDQQRQHLTALFRATVQRSGRGPRGWGGRFGR